MELTSSGQRAILFATAARSTNPTHVGVYQSSVLFYLNPCRKPHIRGDILACADCTPSGQFAPSVLISYHARKTCQGQAAMAVRSTLDRFYLLRDLQKSPTGNAPEDLSVPPAGGTAKAVGGEVPLAFSYGTRVPRSVWQSIGGAGEFIAILLGM